MSTHRVVLCSLILFAASLSFAAERPNVVFFLVDDLGVMDVGAFNAKTFYETPHIDALAREGMRFSQAYAACHVCSPTRYSIMTGRYPARSGLTNFLAGDRAEKFRPAPLQLFMPLKETTIGEAFQQAGYKTAFLGKWHLGNINEYGPDKQGFEVVAGDKRVVPQAESTRIKFAAKSPIAQELFIEQKTDEITRDTLTVIDAWKDEPFFLFCSFYQVHVPLGTSEEFRKKYDAKVAGLASKPSELTDFISDEQVHLAGEPRRVRTVQNHAVYAGMVEHTDRCIGQIVERIDELGLGDNTIIVFMSDNGGLATAEGSPTSNLPFRAGKGWMYEGGIREPLIVRWRGKVRAGSVSDLPVVSTDFYPTLLDLASVPLRAAQHQDGISFAPELLATGTVPPRDAIFWHYPHYSNQGGFPASAVRMGDYKLIQRLEDGRVHLYNLRDDIGEQNDLAASMPERTASMQQRLVKWYEETGAQFLQPNEGETPWRP
ncbi:MAG: sulfatase [Thermoguttaceae bacterium]